MELKRLMQLAGMKPLMEDWADDHATYELVMKTLDEKVPDKAMQGKILAAIEALEDKNGWLTKQEWADHYEMMRAAREGDPIRVIDAVIDLFLGQTVLQKGNQFRWNPETPAAPLNPERGEWDPNSEVDPQAVTQAAMGGELMKAATSMETFTVGSLARVAQRVAREHGFGIPSDMAWRYANHFIETHYKNIEKVQDNPTGDHTYRMLNRVEKKERGTKDYDGLFKSWLDGRGYDHD